MTTWTSYSSVTKLVGPGTTWRNVVNSFSRNDKSNLALLDRASAAAAHETNVNGAITLLQLFGSYDEIESIHARYTKVQTKFSAPYLMGKGKYSNYIKPTKKSERNQVEKGLIIAKAEAPPIHRQVELNLFEAIRKARKEQLLHTRLHPLTMLPDKPKGKLAIVEVTLAGHTRIITTDLEEFYTFFPNAASKQFETVEYYHLALTDILENQLTEQHRVYLAQMAALQTTIRTLQAQIIPLEEFIQLDDETYQQPLKLNTKITQLEEQIRTFDHTQQLKKERQALKTTIWATLSDLTNTQIRDINDALYPQLRRKCPIFTFKAAAKGTGAKSKNLALFVLGVLRSTPLSFIIHNSAIIKTAAFAPAAGLLEVSDTTARLIRGTNEPKQVFSPLRRHQGLRRRGRTYRCRHPSHPP